MPEHTTLSGRAGSAGFSGRTGSAGHSADSGHSAEAPVLRMAGEIAVQFEHRPVAEAAGQMAEHIRQFWDPRMRRALLAAVDAGADVAPAVVAAAGLLRPPR
ncbi:MAG TPA: formate dehydrogenase subunit delta [Pseudonocardia sp.]|nr:formate dehydrogenase subunit delta [Pseudonocardia sp.]